MSEEETEITRRKAAALAAMKATFGTEAGEYNVTLFVTHHLEEIEAAYWEKIRGTVHPKPDDVIDCLVLMDDWSEEDYDGIDVLDFTLPEGVTNYVLSVCFTQNGQVQAITMES